MKVWRKAGEGPAIFGDRQNRPDSELGKPAVQEPEQGPALPPIRESLGDRLRRGDERYGRRRR